jgi:cytochrome b561
MKQKGTSLSMKLTRTSTAFPPGLRGLHWLMAAVIVAAWALGVRSGAFEGPARGAAIGLHIAVASSVLLLAPLRVLMRLAGGVPALPAAMGGAARLAAHGVHVGLYVLMLALPMSGWLAVNSAGRPVSLMGFIDLPTLMAKNQALHERVETLHVALAWILAALVVLHVLAALKHHFIDRDDVLVRMLSRTARG